MQKCLKDKGAGIYEKGSVAVLVPFPDNGYKFTKWSDGDTNPVRQIVVNNNITLTAIFEQE
jgi:uncharacterized repeat protein (TIGR02543 family)